MQSAHFTAILNWTSQAAGNSHFLTTDMIDVTLVNIGCLLSLTLDLHVTLRGNQSLGYVHSCLELAILIKISKNNLSLRSVVLESSVKPSLGCLSANQWLV